MYVCQPGGCQYVVSSTVCSTVQQFVKTPAPITARHYPASHRNTCIAVRDCPVQESAQLRALARTSCCWVASAATIADAAPVVVAAALPWACAWLCSLRHAKRLRMQICTVGPITDFAKLQVVSSFLGRHSACNYGTEGYGKLHAMTIVDKIQQRETMQLEARKAPVRMTRQTVVGPRQ